MPAMSRLMVVAVLAIAIAAPAMAQQPRTAPRATTATVATPCIPFQFTDGCVQWNGVVWHGPSGPLASQGNPLETLTADVLDKLKSDAKYAAARADATNNVVTQKCWHALADLLDKQSQPLTDSQGGVLTKPDPHIITDAEMVSEFLRQLQPDSALSLACAPMLQAAQKDISTLIGGLLSGSALGLFKLPALP